MEVDPFSDILQLIRARCVVTESLSAHGAWSFRSRAAEQVRLLSVVKGPSWVWLEGGTSARVVVGDVLLLSTREALVVSSDPPRAPAGAARAQAPAASGSGSGPGEAHDFLALVVDVLLDAEHATLVTHALAPLLHIRAAWPRAAVLVQLLEQMVRERDGELPGRTLASEQLAQLMFIEALRVHLETSKTLPPGWLRAAHDRRLGPVLSKLHGEPGRAWQLGELAALAAMSRTSFAAYFKTVSGLAPLTYLTEWRMRLAARALRDDDTPVNVIAEQLGYASESAFSVAFKRVTGNAPKRYRTAARTTHPDTP
ncbi:AraC family transcriptional regulator [Paraburkholderia sp. DHOC27]|uniref:AraC family transcriptional regulator n=1 Tax=Paraburkholderia sp. DHOC27 TaxID=2303330 RepID=UPI000E3E1CFC|nr:AraC family transcriptional regulator [Paraburkholderia sp. DHOC27]RFU44809.1 AraC family transcriptional regulator [Paraburkholderia sp. DHOC27]